MRYLHLKKLLLFYLLFLGYSANAQQGRTTHDVLTKQDGIVLDFINAMAFDNDGFLWLGGGILDNRNIILSDKKLVLQRFNGRSFHNIVIPEEFEIQSVGQMFELPNGKMYLNDLSKLVLFDPFTTEFIQISDTFDSMSFLYRFEESVYVLTQEARIITLNRVEPDHSFSPLFSFTSDQFRYSLDGTSRFLPLEDYWLIGDDNFPIIAIRPDGEIVKTFDGTAFSRRLGTSAGKLWMDEVFTIDDALFTMLFENDKLHRFNPETISFDPVSAPNSNLASDNLCIYTDSLGNHIIASIFDNQLSLKTYSDEEGFLSIYEDTSLGPSSRISILSENVETDVWMAVSGAAELHYFKFPKKEVEVYLPNTGIRGIEKLSANNYLVATDGNGWHQLNLEDRTTTKISIEVNDTEYTPNSSRNFFRDGDTLWTNSGSGILKVNLKNRKAERFRFYPVSCMVQPTDSMIVYGTHNYSLMAFNKRTKQHDTLARTDSLRIHDLHWRKGSDVIIGATDAGMLYYHLKDEQLRVFNDPEMLSDSFLLMTDFHPEYGHLLGTRSGKIFAFEPEDESFTLVYEDALKAGIASVLFRGETWWINTFNGVVAFTPKDSTAIRYSEKDGFSNNEGNRYSAFDTGDGLLLGSIAGLNYFKPESLQPEILPSELRLLKVRSYNEEQKMVIDVFDQRQLSKDGPIVLPSEFKELQLDFALTHNVENREHRFRYKINDEDFIEINEEQSIRFPILAPGNYRLEIEARDFSSKRIGAPLVLNIVSKNFFYKTWWFYLIVVLMVIFLLTYLLKQSRLKQKLQEQFSRALILSQEAERTRIAKELHDSVGQQLTLIKQRSQNESQPEISEMTHNALEEVRSISRGLYPSVLKQLGLTESIEQLIFDLDEQIDMFFSAEIDQIDDCFDPDDTLNFYRFIQESLTNVIKHSKAKSVSIRIERKTKYLEATIEDNGVGFEMTDTEKSKSLGLKTLMERIRILNGNLRILSKPNTGTTIHAEIPIE